MISSLRRSVFALVFILTSAQFAVATSEVEGDAAQDAPLTIRHDIAQPGEPIITLRYFRIKPGTYDMFIAESQEGVWPFFEKIGARVVGMWQVVYPQEAASVVSGSESKANPDYDEVWLMTRYASVAHWQATREMAALGGNGADYDRAILALQRRRAVTLYTDIRFLDGTPWDNPPLFMPALPSP